MSVSSSLKRLLKKLQEQEAEEKAKGQDIESKDQEGILMRELLMK